jgi:hypothetical protein
MEKETKTKVCRKCGKEKALSEFYKAKKNRDGLYNLCKVCVAKRGKAHRHSLKGFLRKLYNNQKKRSKRRGHPQPAYTFDEFKNWFVRQPNFKFLWRQWRSSGYLKDLAPSVDRLDDSKGYSFDNIRLVTWQENNLKEHDKHKVKVNQYSLDGRYLKTFESLSDAAREIKSTSTNIRSACKGRRKSAGGYRWKYLNQEFPKGKDIGEVKRNKTNKWIKVNYSDNTYKVFDSVKACCKFHRCASATLRRVINGLPVKHKQLQNIKVEYIEKDSQND